MKKLLPKIFDINYQYSQENNDEIINSNNNKYIGIKESDGEKTKLLQMKIITILILKMVIIIIKF